MYISKQPQAQKIVTGNGDPEKQNLIDLLLLNRIGHKQLQRLQGGIDADDLSDIIQRIYDLNEKYILKLSAVDGLLRKLNDIKNEWRNDRFKKEIKHKFRDSSNKKVILAEGDSWFNYPVILTDIIDRISMDKDFAVYSLAAGGDWLLNMLSARNYVEQLSVIHPDVFLISGGGNDLVGSARIAAVVDPQGASMEFDKCEFAKYLIENAHKDKVPLDKNRFDKGVKHLSKDFFALLMFFHLQYYFLIGGILRNARKKGDKFYGIKIITQGYDYVQPSFNKSFGLNPLLWYVPFIRSFLGHGTWLKRPLQLRGILNDDVQKDILYAMIYLFNEMMINIGRLFNETDCCHVCHIDSRGSIPSNGWTDELHPRPEYFMKTARIFIDCIKETQSPTYEHVYIVNQFYSEI